MWRSINGVYYLDIACTTHDITYGLAGGGGGGPFKCPYLLTQSKFSFQLGDNGRLLISLSEWPRDFDRPLHSLQGIAYSPLLLPDR